jgi:ABC-type transporter Mla MlaB component
MRIEKTYDKERRCVIACAGPLTAASVKDAWLDIFPYLRAYDMLVLDLKLLDDIDTAGIQLLAVLKKNAHLTRTKIKFINHSAAVLKLIEIYGVTGLFRDKILLQKGPETTGRFRYGVAPQEF